MNYKVLLVIMLFGNVVVARAQTGVAEPTNYVNKPAMIMDCPCHAPFLLGLYEPEVISTMAELPPDVTKKIETYLLTRVGVSFFKTLSFIECQRVNLTKEDSMQIGIKNYKWRIAAYYLRFNCLALKDAHGNYFETGASFDANGNIIDSVNLPRFTNGSNLFKIIAPEQAVKIGRANWDVTKRKNWISKKTLFLSYSPLNKSFVWWFSSATAEEPGKVI